MDLFFCHIQKTGGLSFQKILKDVYGQDNCFDIVDVFVDRERFESKESRIIYGHAPYDLVKLLSPDCTIISIFRDPVERIISYWKYVIRENQDVKVRPLFKEKRFESIIHSSLFIGCLDHQTKVIGSEIDFFGLLEKIKSIKDPQRKVEVWSEEYNLLFNSILYHSCNDGIFKRAMRRIEKIQVVDFRQYFKGINSILNRLHINQTIPPLLNRSPFDQSTVLDTFAGVFDLRQLNKYDNELYNHVSNNWRV